MIYRPTRRDLLRGFGGAALAHFASRTAFADKPTAGATLNAGNTYYTNLTYVYPLWTLTDTELRSSASTTSVGSTSPDADTSPTFGQGFKNTAVTNKDILLNLTTGLVKNQSKWSLVMLARPHGTPGSGLAHAYVNESVNDGASSRLALSVVNGTAGATGIKWNFLFRVGAQGSTSYSVNAGAGGTTVASDTDYVIGFDFDSDADAYTLYVNGQQEAQRTDVLGAMPNTNPYYPTRLLAVASDGTSGANGGIFHLAVWHGAILGPTGHSAMATNPWRFYTGHDSVATKARSPIIAMVPQTRMAW